MSSEVTQLVTVHRRIGNRNYSIVNCLSEELSYLTLRKPELIIQKQEFGDKSLPKNEQNVYDSSINNLLQF